MQENSAHALAETRPHPSFEVEQKLKKHGL